MDSCWRDKAPFWEEVPVDEFLVQLSRAGAVRVQGYVVGPDRIRIRPLLDKGVLLDISYGYKQSMILREEELDRIEVHRDKSLYRIFLKGDPLDRPDCPHPKFMLGVYKLEYLWEKE